MPHPTLLAPNHTHNTRLDLQRDSQLALSHPEIKDPSIVQLNDGTYQMFVSIGNSTTQKWIVGRFHAIHPAGPWFEMSPVKFVNLSGSQLCAPAVRYETVAGQGHWSMYIQTSCFDEDGHIALAYSTDGEVFYGTDQPLITRQMLSNSSEVVGLYDAGISEVIVDGNELLCMLFSGYRKIGCGDIYMTYRPKNETEDAWALPQRILAQEEVPFHNHPQYEWYEWGLEGAQIIQLGRSSFLLVGVCFLPKPKEFAGTRQRVFMAHAPSLIGPFIPITTPFEPDSVDGRSGENGHPDVVVRGNELWVIYQERYGEGQPWHLRSARLETDEINEYLMESIQKIHQVAEESVPPTLWGKAVPGESSRSIN